MTVACVQLGLSLSGSTGLIESGDMDASERERVQSIHVANRFYTGRTAEALDLARRIRPSLPLRTLSDAIALSLWSRVSLETGERWAELDTWMTGALDEGVQLRRVRGPASPPAR
jgi:hypothetical protein